MRVMAYLKSRTVWMGLLGFILTGLTALQVDSLVGLPVDELVNNKAVLASQLTAIAAGVCDLLAILFRIKAKAKFE